MSSFKALTDKGGATWVVAGSSLLLDGLPALFVLTHKPCGQQWTVAAHAGIVNVSSKGDLSVNDGIKCRTCAESGLST